MKKLFLALLISVLCIVSFTVIASAKDINLGITDVNGNEIVVSTEDSDGDALIWYYVTSEPTDGKYYEYASGTEARYLKSAKAKDITQISDDNLITFSSDEIKGGGSTVVKNLLVANFKGITKEGETYKFGFYTEATGIVYMYFPKEITSIKGFKGTTEYRMFYDCTSLKEVEFEAGSLIDVFGSLAFYNCKSLTKMVLPENLVTIKATTFSNTTIELTIPKSVTEFLVSDTSKLTIHFTGTAEDHAGWTYQPTKIDYVSHCDVYRNGVHTAGETVDYITSCSECGAQMYCENPAHNLVTSISYASYAQAGVKSVLCTDCGLDAKETSTPAIITFKGYSKNPEGTSICVGYTIDKSALESFKALNPELATFEYGLAVAIEGAVQDNKPLAVDENGVGVANKSVIMVKLGSTSYTKVEMKLSGDFSNNQNTGILMSAYVYDGEKLVYIQGDENNNSTELDKVNAITMAQLSE